MKFEDKIWYAPNKTSGVVEIPNLREYLKNESMFTQGQIDSILHLSKFAAEKYSHTNDVGISVRLKNDTEQYVYSYNPLEYCLEPSNYAITPVQKADGSTKIIESAKSGLVLALGAPALFFGNTHFSLDPAGEGFFTNMREYCFGSLRGHISFCSAGIAIHNVINLIPHNGDFDDFITTMEAFAQEQQVDLVFMYIINERFAAYLAKRGYTNYAICGMFGMGKTFHKKTDEWFNKRLEALGDALLHILNEPEHADKKEQFAAFAEYASRKCAEKRIDPNNMQALKKSGLAEEFAHKTNEIFFGVPFVPNGFVYADKKNGVKI